MVVLDTEQDVLTLDEVASFLRVSAESLQSEITSGRLPALQIGDEVRILKQDLMEFLELAKAYGGKLSESTGRRVRVATANARFDLQLKPSEPFSYRWPSGTVEKFSEAHEGTAHVGNGVKAVRVGFTERKSAGKLRGRAVIFIDKRPMVEFVASDDFDKSGLMVSLLKHKNGKQARPTERIPPEYQHFTIERYDQYVTGPYASSNLAVTCSRTDLNVMVEHALLRQRQIEARK